MVDRIGYGTLALFQKVAVGRDDTHIPVDQQDRRGDGVEKHGVKDLIAFERLFPGKFWAYGHRKVTKL
jgi:hypothetical protein